MSSLNGNWVILQDDERNLRVISECLFVKYMEKLDDRRVTFKDCMIDIVDDTEARKNDPYKFGDWNHLNAKITGYYKLVV